jgi:hypothetical protein
MTRNLREIFETIKYSFIHSSIAFYTCEVALREGVVRKGCNHSVEGVPGGRGHADDWRHGGGCRPVLVITCVYVVTVTMNLRQLMNLLANKYYCEDSRTYISVTETPHK